MLFQVVRILFFAWTLTATSVTAFASSPSTFTTTSAFRAPWSDRPSSKYRARSPSLVHYSLAAIPRGGGGAFAAATSTPQSLFNYSLVSLALLTACAKLLQRLNAKPASSLAPKSKPASILSLQSRFLPVFWIIKCADWIQGAYFYDVYASKVFNGAQASLSLVSRLFLTGFASTALFGPSVGRAADKYGRKKATLAFSVIYAAGALSTKSPLLMVLFLGRVLSGIGTSLLFSAPESWLVGEAQNSGDDPDGKYLGETFGMAYAGDSVVAILAGQISGRAASLRGSTGPFEVSTTLLLLGGLLAALLWKENAAPQDATSKDSTIWDAVDIVRKDPKIMYVGSVQALFEAAMYIFVLQWPPAMAKAIAATFGEAAAVPYGTIFSCLMACCLLGSTLFGQLSKMGVLTEVFTLGFLSVATVAMSAATWMLSSGKNALWGLMASFFAFEACVGMYFPSIGTLRSKYFPDSNRSVVMNLFGIPLNVLVATVTLSIQLLGIRGALSISSGALGLATISMLLLNRMIASTKRESE